MIIYDLASKFKSKYPITLTFRMKSHCKVIENHLDSDEKVKYVFAGQKNDTSFEFPNTFVIVFTNKRMLLGKKRLLFGYLYYAITPNMLNDITVKSGLMWGKIIIDTVKEQITISNISRNALDEIETEITNYMIENRDSKISKK